MRVQVNLSDEMVNDVDKYSKAMGVSRSALCSMLIGQGIMGYNTSMDIVKLIGQKVGEKALNEASEDK